MIREILKTIAGALGFLFFLCVCWAYLLMAWAVIG